jgi:hypothetical protein
MTFRSHPVLAALLCAAQLALFAPPAPAAEAVGPARVSVAYAGTPLKDALRQFQDKSGIRLAYAEDLLAGAAPVTLKREHAPAERVLRELLRPQGLEAILTDKNLVAVVPAWSDLGMAKAFGRALDIGLRLGNKLDGAKVVGDEVKVSGWTEEDDADLALGITDLCVTIAYAEGAWRMDATEAERRLAPLLASADPAVRAGALVAAGGNSAWSALRQDAAAEKALSDPHPAVRTAAAILQACALGYSSDKRLASQELARKLARDPEAGVRMAVACWLLIDIERNKAIDPDGAVFKQLLADRSAFVRQTLRLVTLAESRSIERLPEGELKRRWQALAKDGLAETLRDPNPIARAVSFGFAQIMQLEQRGRDGTAPRDRVAEIWTEAELAKDPWMKTVHSLIAPALAGDYQVALEKTVAAVGSDKPSHQAAALLSLGFSYLSARPARPMPQAAGRGEKPAPPKIPDLAPLVARLSSSKWLWGRLSGIALDAALPFAGPLSAKPLPPEALKAAEGRISAALASPDESVRLVALLAHYGRTMVGLPSQPEPILAALHSRRVPEMLLGARLANESLAPERLLEETNVLLDDPSRRIATEALLGGIWCNRSLQRVAPDARLDFARQLAALVIARNDPAFDIALFKNQWIWVNITERGRRVDELKQKALVEMVLTKASLKAVAARYRNGTIRDTEASILMNRLKLAAADPAKRAVVLETWAALEDHLYNLPDRENPAAVLALLDQAMAGGPANAREAAGRLRALPSLFSELKRRNQEQWGVEIKRLPTNLAKALELALASAGDPTPSTETVALLVATVDNVNNAGGVKRGWLREAWTANHPTLIQALDSAVQKILAGNREDDKVQVWCALARSGDKPAVAALTERILDGRVSDQMVPNVMNTAAANPDLMPPEFAPALLKLVRDPAQGLDRRCALIRGLNMCPNYSRRLAGDIEALAWDDKFESKLRSQALSFLVHNSAKEAVPALIQKVLKGYDTLPVEMAEQLGSLACNRLATPGAEDLLVRVIEDKRLRGENGAMTFQSLLFHLESAQGLDKLKAPDRLRQALDKLEKEWPAERRDELENHMLPHRLQQLRQKLDQRKPATPAQPAGAGDF